MARSRYHGNRTIHRPKGRVLGSMTTVSVAAIATDVSRCVALATRLICSHHDSTRRSNLIAPEQARIGTPVLTPPPGNWPVHHRRMPKSRWVGWVRLSGSARPKKRRTCLRTFFLRTTSVNTKRWRRQSRSAIIFSRSHRRRGSPSCLNPPARRVFDRVRPRRGHCWAVLFPRAAAAAGSAVSAAGQFLGRLASHRQLDHPRTTAPAALPAGGARYRLPAASRPRQLVFFPSMSWAHTALTRDMPDRALPVSSAR